MKRYLALLLSVSIFAGNLFAASDAFNQNTGSAQAIATYSSNWAVMVGGFTIPTGNVGEYRSNTSNDNLARWTGPTPSGNQEAITTVTSGQQAHGNYSGPAIGLSSVAVDGYALIATGADYYVGKFTAGVEADFPGFPLSWSPALALGDRLKLSKTVSGSTVTLKVWKALAASPTSFTQVGSDITDASSAYTTGTYGIYGNGDAASGGFGAGPWTGNDLSAGGRWGVFGDNDIFMLKFGM